MSIIKICLLILLILFFTDDLLYHTILYYTILRYQVAIWNDTDATKLFIVGTKYVIGKIKFRLFQNKNRHYIIV